jgi:hypothetical protein
LDHLVDHPGGTGVTDEGNADHRCAVIASTGRLIDRFGTGSSSDPPAAGFSVRWSAASEPHRCRPARTQYVNTGDTPLFHKGTALQRPDTKLSRRIQ